MNEEYFEGEEYNGIDFSLKGFVKGQYDDCIFSNCNFSNVDLSIVNFGECEFIDCDLSLAKIVGSLFRSIQFKNCKLLGLHFEDCKDFLFEVQFEGCQLNLTSFYRRKLKKTRFENCVLEEVDFSEADLTEAVFLNSNLDRAIFQDSILFKADFRTSYNYSIDPESNRIRKAKFSREGLLGLLGKYDIDIE